jgi:hypothetical protein
MFLPRKKDGECTITFYINDSIYRPASNNTRFVSLSCNGRTNGNPQSERERERERERYSTVSMEGRSQSVAPLSIFYGIFIKFSISLFR